MVFEATVNYILDLVNIVFGGYGEQMTTLVLYTLGMVFYGIVIWNYYRHLAKRDIFKIDLSKYRYQEGGIAILKRFSDALVYILKYLIIFPLYSFLWFMILSFFLFFLAKTQTPEGILLVAITIVSAVRVTAYYNEDLSKDLAKMIPFALLGIFIVDPTFFSLGAVYQRFVALPGFLDLIGRYLLFVIILEFGLRVLLGLIKFAHGIFSPKQPEAPAQPTAHPKIHQKPPPPHPAQPTKR